MTTERDRRNQTQYEVDQAEKRGLEKGEKIGEARGKAEGIEETKLATAKKMLAKNYPIDEISELTGLPVETMKELQ